MRDRETHGAVSAKPVSRIGERLEGRDDVRVTLGLRARRERDRVVARDDAQRRQEIAALSREESGRDREREIPIRDGRGVVDPGGDVRAEPHRRAPERDGARAEGRERHLGAGGARPQEGGRKRREHLSSGLSGKPRHTGP